MIHHLECLIQQEATCYITDGHGERLLLSTIRRPAELWQGKHELKTFSVVAFWVYQPIINGYQWVM